MKRICIALMMPLLIMMLIPGNSIMGTTTDTIGIIIDGQQVNLDTAPVIIKGRTLVPLRGVFEELGATVDWNKETRQAIVKNDRIEVLLSPDTGSALINGEINVLDTASTIVDERLLIPVRFVAEALGHSVGWDSTTRNVLITTSEETTPFGDTELPVIGSREALVDLLKYNTDLHQYVDLRFGMALIEPEILDAMPRTGDDGLDFEEETSNAVTQDTAKAEVDYSGTNNQVDGVDEGDIVKTNGQQIATVSGRTINIIDATPTAPKLLSTINISQSRGYVSNLYLTEDQLVVIGSSSVMYGIPEPFLDSPKLMPQTYHTSNTFVLVYDLTNPESPELTTDMDYEGYYVSSRLLEQALYMVTEKSINYWSIDTLTDYEIQPKYANNLTGETTLVTYDELNYFPDYVAQSIMMTVGLNLDTGASDVEAYMGNAENVYATSDDLYLTFTHYEYAEQYNTLIYVPNYTKTTSIYRFGLDEATITYEDKGEVPGSVLNQFSLDAYDGYLRIATTTGEMWDDTNLSKNNLYILDKDLDLVGQVTDLAPGERIYSTRFHQDRIYMVTYRQVDPFFVIDASDPTAPEVLGELKIPGFSTYMHILDSNHVLGFGTETDEDGSTIRTGGLKLSLFDVTDPEKPVESQKEVIGVAGTYSELQYNHKALMISLNKGVLAFPITVANTTPYSTDFNGAYVYDIDSESFTYRGRVSHKTAEDAYYNYGSSIKRLLYIGDYLYSISDQELVVSNLDDLTKVSDLDLVSNNEYFLPIIEPRIIE